MKGENMYELDNQLLIEMYGYSEYLDIFQQLDNE